MASCTKIATRRTNYHVFFFFTFLKYTFTCVKCIQIVYFFVNSNFSLTQVLANSLTGGYQDIQTEIVSKFNNRTVDIAGGPALVFEPMELHKGMDPDGGIIRYPMLQITVQILSRRAQFPDTFGQQSREYVTGNFDTAMKMVLDSEARIPEKYWIEVDGANEGDWAEIFRQNRILLRDKGIYDGKALTLFRKIRCKMDASRAECSADDKE